MKRNLLITLLLAVMLLSWANAQQTVKTRITNLVVQCDGAKKRAVVKMQVDAVSSATAQVKLSAKRVEADAKEKGKKLEENIEIRDGINDFSLNLPLGNTAVEGARYQLTATLDTPNGKDIKAVEFIWETTKP